MQNCMTKSSRQILLKHILKTGSLSNFIYLLGTAVCGSCTLALRSNLAGFARHFNIKKQNRPHRRKWGFAHWFWNNAWLLYVFQDPGWLRYCCPKTGLFCAALHALQKTGSQCFIIWLMHEGLCLPPVCLKLKYLICFLHWYVSGISVLIK